MFIQRFTVVYLCSDIEFAFRQGDFRITRLTFIKENARGVEVQG